MLQWNPWYHENGSEPQSTFPEVYMAEAANKFKTELDPVEKQWLQKALQDLRERLNRARGKERVGSEIHALRGREIEEVQALLVKFS